MLATTAPLKDPWRPKRTMPMTGSLRTGVVAMVMEIVNRAASKVKIKGKEDTEQLLQWEKNSNRI